MKKILLSFVLIIVVVLTSAIFPIDVENAAKHSSKKYSQTDLYISTAIRSLTDSKFKNFKLAASIYAQSFTNDGLIVETFGKKGADALKKLTAKKKSKNFKASVVSGLYGGSSIKKKIKGLSGSPSRSIKSSKLKIGDILVYRIKNEVKLYIKDKDNFVNLSSTKSRSVKKVLKEVKKSKVFVVLRPLNIVKKYSTLPEKANTKLSKGQQAVLTTAESYLLKGDKVYYSNAESNAKRTKSTLWKPGQMAPEDYTSKKSGLMNCSSFCYDVYYFGLGMKLEYKGKKLTSTPKIVKYSKKMDINVYDMKCKKSNQYTKKSKEKLKKEILKKTQPADIIVIRRADGTGHAMIYAGDGEIIHSSGAIYVYGSSKGSRKASIRRMKFEDYFFSSKGKGYVFGSNRGKKVVSFHIIRPLKKWKGKVPQQTKNRIENLSGMTVEKVSSTQKVEAGKKITYTFNIRNTKDKSAKLNIKDTLPKNTKYVSSSKKIKNNKLNWNVKISANSKVSLSYTVIVKDKVKKGTKIQSAKATVGGVKVKCENVIVS